MKFKERSKVEHKNLLVQIFVSQIIIILSAGLLLYITDVKMYELKIDFISWGLLAGGLTYLLGFLLTKLEGTLGQSLRDLAMKLRLIVGGLSLPSIIIISLLAGLGEELLFRAFLQEWIAGYSSSYIGIMIASIIFGLLHFISRIYFLFAFLMGVLFGIGYEATQSLIFVGVWHAFYDFLALLMIVKFPSLLQLKSED